MASAKWRPSCLGLNVLTVQVMALVTNRLLSNIWINVDPDQECHIMSPGHNAISCIGYRGVVEDDKCGALSSAVITGSYSHHIALCGNYRAYSRQWRRLALNTQQVSREKRGNIFFTLSYSPKVLAKTRHILHVSMKKFVKSLWDTVILLKNVPTKDIFIYHLPAWKSQISLWQLFSPKYTYEKHSIHKYRK